MKQISILLLIFLTSLQVDAQDIHTSQFWNTPLQYNPAMAGVSQGSIRAAVFYRNQWSSVNSPFNSFGLNADTRFETRGNTSFGVGINVFRDIAGDLKLGTTKAQLALSAILSMNDRSKISIGLCGGMVQKGFNPSAAKWSSQFSNGSYNYSSSSGETFEALSELKGDLSVGAVYYYSSSERYMTANDNFNMKIGFSYNHILRPKFTWRYTTPDPLYSNFIVHSSFLIGVNNSKWTLLPSIIGQFQGPSKEIVLGTQFRYKIKDASKITGFIRGVHLNLGAYYRLKDAVIPSITFEIDNYSIGFSYDINVSRLTPASRGAGGFEISLKFKKLGSTPMERKWHVTRTISLKLFKARVREAIE